MKRTVSIILASAALLATACSEKQYGKEPGTLMISKLSTDGSTIELATKADLPQADDNYWISITDANGEAVKELTWGQMKESEKKILLEAGNYNLNVRSTTEEIPAAGFDCPAFAAVESFSVKAGEVVVLDDVVCKLAQTMITVDYADGFYEMLDGEATVSFAIDEKYPLDFFVNADGSHETRTGYLVAPQKEACTMTLSFKGSIEGRVCKMTRVFEGILAAQVHNVTFTFKEVDEGNATLIVSIDGLVEDAELTTEVEGVEKTMGDDPDAPTGDGGIKMISNCDYKVDEPIVVPAEGNPFVLRMTAVVPNKVNKFTVEIQSTNAGLVDAVKLVNDGSAVLDLCNPAEGAKEVFTTILPFPYGDAVKGQSEVPFNLDDAQAPMLAFPGTHTFVMKVTDKKGCKKEINLQMIVNE